MKTIFVIPIAVLLLSCSSCNWFVTPPPPQKEFVFPLAVGNKWVYDFTYDYSSGKVRQGTEEWGGMRRE
jgi:hypothetical protein